MSRRKAKQTTLESLNDVRRAAERTAAAGWQDLADTLDSAASRTHDIADGTRSRVTSLSRDVRDRGKKARRRGEEVRKRGMAARDEAQRRTNAAREALSGKRSHTWQWVVAAAAAGVAAGAAVVQFGRRLIQSREQAQLERIEQTVADVTSEPTDAGRMNGRPTPAASAAGTGSGAAPNPRTDPTTVKSPTADS